MDTIEQVDFSDFPKYFSMTIASPRNSGKNVLLKAMLNELRKTRQIDLCVLFSGTHHLQKDTYNFIAPRLRFHSSEANEKISEILEIQQQYLKKHKFNKDKIPTVLIILDDIQADLGRNNKIIQKLYLEGRHSGCIVISCFQTLNNMNPELRKNSEIIAVFRSSNYHQNKMIIEKYLSYENSLEVRKMALNYMERLFNEPYVAMFILAYKMQQVKKLEDFVKKYKADIDKVDKMDYKLGNEKFWK